MPKTGTQPKYKPRGREGKSNRQVSIQYSLGCAHSDICFEGCPFPDECHYEPKPNGPEYPGSQWAYTDGLDYSTVAI